ncbi:membrane protein DedA, SNARE-associated domain [Micromonospora haikouensis]|uniref:Membrane protein DedA, SNARE-associated domain n=1 Tax=Micromonospora haikouensis TaxID=686309 RepID=A0A1C4WXL6_9ACTN|nr:MULTISPECIES: DedA family protein [Micromonospora]MDI5937514.1 DedA family protein [Micromonospora sp. DH15]OON33001.1 DedA protein [Micromonospora sp. Rc5]SCF00930.1 membrane protein DedA, SNARE-associated domain [Micromonospora haikouensis]
MQSVLGLLHDTVTSPWVYLVIFAVTAVDAVFPAVPGETIVVTAGVFAVGGQPDLTMVIVLAACGALAGDHLSYAIGRSGGAHRLARLPADSRRRAGSEWARRAVDRRGGMMLTTARYVPGGRTAVTLTMGAVRYPLRSFVLFDALAAGTWAAYCGLLGYFGGLAFEREPVKGILAGIGLSVAITGLLEAARWLRLRARRRAAGRPR